MTQWNLVSRSSNNVLLFQYKLIFFLVQDSQSKTYILTYSKRIITRNEFKTSDLSTYHSKITDSMQPFVPTDHWISWEIIRNR